MVRISIFCLVKKLLKLVTSQIYETTHGPEEQFSTIENELVHFKLEGKCRK